jgi:large subunit ribosomal protein L35
MKTHKGAAKRFKVTSTGKILHQKAFGSHLLTKKSAKRKRNYQRDYEVAAADKRKVKKMLGT